MAYNLESFGGIIHTDAGFAAAWGAFPVLTAYVAQTGRLSVGAVLAAGGAFAFSHAQRRLSTPARLVRRRAALGGGAHGAAATARCTTARRRPEPCWRPSRQALRAPVVGGRPAAPPRSAVAARLGTGPSGPGGGVDEPPVGGLADLLANHPAAFQVAEVGQGLADRGPPHEALDLRPTAGSTSCGSASPQVVVTPSRMAAIASSKRA